MERKQAKQSVAETKRQRDLRAREAAERRSKTAANKAKEFSAESAKRGAALRAEKTAAFSRDDQVDVSSGLLRSQVGSGSYICASQAEEIQKLSQAEPIGSRAYESAYAGLQEGEASGASVTAIGRVASEGGAHEGDTRTACWGETEEEEEEEVAIPMTFEAAGHGVSRDGKSGGELCVWI